MTESTDEKPKKVPVERRMGPAGSETWHAMLDGAEYILREEGHASLTSRRIAECVGVKQRLVYYYFRTMDELIVDLFKRSSERGLKGFYRALESENPLHTIWTTNAKGTDARLISQFMALANRIDALKIEVISFIEKSRQLEIEAINREFERRSMKSPIDPAALAIIASSLALTLNREAQLGVEFGHDAVENLVETFFKALG